MKLLIKLINKRADFNARENSSSINGSVVSKQYLESTHRHMHVHGHTILFMPCPSFLSSLVTACKLESLFL